MSEKMQVLNQTISNIQEHFDTEEFLYRYLIFLKEEIKFSYKSAEPFEDAADAILNLFEKENENSLDLDHIDRIANLVINDGVKPERIMYALALMTEQYGGIRVLQETYVFYVNYPS